MTHILCVVGSKWGEPVSSHYRVQKLFQFFRKEARNKKVYFRVNNERVLFAKNVMFALNTSCLWTAACSELSSSLRCPDDFHFQTSYSSQGLPCFQSDDRYRKLNSIGDNCHKSLPNIPLGRCEKTIKQPGLLKCLDFTSFCLSHSVRVLSAKVISFSSPCPRQPWTLKRVKKRCSESEFC